MHLCGLTHKGALVRRELYRIQHCVILNTRFVEAPMSSEFALLKPL